MHEYSVPEAVGTAAVYSDAPCMLPARTNTPIGQAECVTGLVQGGAQKKTTARTEKAVSTSTAKSSKAIHIYTIQIGIKGRTRSSGTQPARECCVVTKESKREATQWRDQSAIL